MLDAFAVHDPRVLVDRLTVGKWGHYSQLGNEIVAKQFQRYLNDQGLVSRDVIKALTRDVREKQSCRPNAALEASVELEAS
jgi:hypothetical protein